MGNAALFNTTGNNNTAVGSLALLTSTTGNNNIAIGRAAALNVTTGSDNIHIGNQGITADTALIRIGTQGTQMATFIAGISDRECPDGQPVVVNSNGQLGDDALHPSREGRHPRHGRRQRGTPQASPRDLPLQGRARHGSRSSSTA